MSESQAASAEDPLSPPVTAASLARERCVEVPAGTSRLTREEARALAGGLAPEWHVSDADIRREFTFRTFNEAFGLATRVALLAEAQGHHPELEIALGSAGHTVLDPFDRGTLAQRLHHGRPHRPARGRVTDHTCAQPGKSWRRAGPRRAV